MTESEKQLGLSLRVAAQLGVPHVALPCVANGCAAISSKWRKQASYETRWPCRCVGSTVGVMLR
jgi:hypothetical protein